MKEETRKGESSMIRLGNVPHGRIVWMAFPVGAKSSRL